MTARDLLQDCLSREDARLSSLKSALDGVEATFLNISTGDGASLFNIYSVRAKMAKDRRSATEGYDDLVTNLRDAKDGEVMILHVNTENKSFLAFFETAGLRLLGVLSGSRSTRGSSTH